MNLTTLVALMQAGGPGSGCRGDNCGRPASGKDQTRADRSKTTYKPATQEKQAIADKSEKYLSRMLGLPRTKNNSAFDLQTPKVGVEVKTMVDQANSKITCHPESCARKRDEASKNGLRMYTVVIDKRGSVPGYYVATGVGSFRLGSMRRVSIGELRRIIK